MMRQFFRHLREALKSISRHFGRSFGSITSVSLTLILVGVFALVLLNVSKIAEDAAKDVKVNVFIDSIATPENVTQLEAQLQTIPEVDSITFVTKEQELERLRQAFGTAFDQLPGDSNPLFDVYVLQASAPEHTKSIAEAAQSFEFVQRANYGGINADQYLNAASWIRWIGLSLIVVLVVVAVFLISNTIRLTIIARRTEIEIMRLVGATRSFIRWPFLLEGAIIGLLGSIVPVVLVVFGYTFVYNHSMGSNPAIAEGSVNGAMSLLAPNALVGYLSIGLILIGVGIGSIGSVLSISRFLKK